MKTAASLIFIFLISGIFLSCSRDELTSPGPNPSASYFNWTVSNITQTSVKKISQGNADNLFIAGTASYRISHGVQTQIDFSDPDFTAYEVSALDSAYAVFLGSHAGNTTPVIKIYDNGIIQTHIPPGVTNPMTGLYVYERGKFFIGTYYLYTIFKFDNGVFSGIPIPSTSNPYLFGNLSGNFYAFTVDINNNARIIYKITGNSIAQVRGESNAGNIFFLNNDFIKIESFGTSNKFYYFNGADWTALFTAFSSSKYEYVQYITGSSRNFFTFLVLDNSSYKAYTYNGAVVSQQTNFPSGLSGSLNLSEQQISEYKNNSFYFCFNQGAKLLKAVYTQ
jgi:hypothetical protein